MRSKNIEYIAGVDHIRAFASLLVVFHHSFWLIHRRWESPGLTPDTWISDFVVVDEGLKPGGRSFSRAKFAVESGDPRVHPA